MARFTEITTTSGGTLTINIDTIAAIMSNYEDENTSILMFTGDYLIGGKSTCVVNESYKNLRRRILDDSVTK